MCAFSYFFYTLSTASMLSSSSPSLSPFSTCSHSRSLLGTSSGPGNGCPSVPGELPHHDILIVFIKFVPCHRSGNHLVYACSRTENVFAMERNAERCTQTVFSDGPVRTH